MNKKIFITNDHTGVEMKLFLKECLEKDNYNVLDIGTSDYNNSNYAELGLQLGQKVLENQNSIGIAICGTGVGISISCNKVKGIRAGLVYETQTAKLIKEHNNCNIIALGARLIANDKAYKIVNEFLNTKFLGDRHSQRINCISDYENK